MMANAEKFFLELGNGFAFLGREVRLEVGETEKFIDLLFYNVQLHCYIVIEVKATDFDSALTESQAELPLVSRFFQIVGL